MAENKKSFLLYCDLIHTVSKMPNEKAGELFKHILSYVNDESPTTDDLIIELTFEPIKQQLKRDLQKYYSICERNKTNGGKGGRPKTQTNPKKPTGLFGNPTEPKKPDTDTDTDKDIIIKTWRNDFKTYYEELISECKKLKDDKEWLSDRQKYHSNLDIFLSLNKAVKDYWGTEEGWKQKKKDRKTIKINWKLTMANALSIKSNQVWKQKEDRI